MKYFQNLDAQDQTSIVRSYWTSAGPSDAWQQISRSLLVDEIADIDVLGQLVEYAAWGPSSGHTVLGVCNGTVAKWFKARGCQNPFAVLNGSRLACQSAFREAAVAALSSEYVVNGS